jgi:hypothetical protein
MRCLQKIETREPELSGIFVNISHTSSIIKSKSWMPMSLVTVHPCIKER